MSIERRQRRKKDGTLGPVSWRARVRTPEGKELSRSFKKKVDAEQWKTAMSADKLRGSFVDPRAGRRTFKDYAEELQANNTSHEPGTTEQIASHFKNHVYPTFGHRSLAAIRTSDVQAWMKGRQNAELAPATIETMFRHVSAVFNAAVAEQAIGRNPCQGVKPPKNDRQPVVPPTSEQVATLIAAAPERLRGIVVLAAGSGMRQGEILGLNAERVQWLRRSVDVVEQLWTPSKGSPAVKRLKSAKARRTIPLPDVVLSALTEHVKAFPVGDDGLLFTDDRGLPWRRSRFIEAWNGVCGTAGVKVKFHGLRHFYASVLIRGGESVKVVQERLGHASARETLDTYAHLWPDDEERTRSVIDAAMAGVFGAAQTRPTETLGG